MKILDLLGYVAIIIVFAVVWYPDISHYYVPNANISDVQIDKLKNNPPDEVLQEIGQWKILASDLLEKETVLDAAKDILKGSVNLPGYPRMKFALPFDSKDMEQGPPGWQLLFSGFVLPNILIEAYKLTGEERYIETAGRMLEAWAHYERSVWLPKGFLWNDHAVASRILVLGEYWRVYRSRSDFDARHAQQILSLADRGGQILCKKSHFTFGTNHGVIQNLALLHFSLSFPELQNAEKYKSVALSRLDEQLGFYINSEGVVLEHSAGYHREGMQLMAKAFRYMTLLGENLPVKWIEKYKKAMEYYRAILRPDGSLPMYGDTQPMDDGNTTYISDIDDNNRASALRKMPLPEKYPTWNLFPVSGYGVWWNDLSLSAAGTKTGKAQTLIAWSYFPGHGHKLADEMSVLLWADGGTWWTNVGYWPYGIDGRKDAESWYGSNAPHLEGESPKSIRNTRLVHYNYSPEFPLRFIELEREGPGGFRANRQIMQLGSDVWVILDSSTHTQEKQATHTWLTYPDVSVSEVKGNGANAKSFVLSRAGNSTQLLVDYLNSNGQIEVIQGKKSPHLGWVVLDHNNISKTNAFKITYPANNSWSIAIWRLVSKEAGENANLKPEVVWKNKDSWEIGLPLKTDLNISRNQKSISVNDKTGMAGSVRIKAAADINREIHEIRSQFNAGSNKYEKFRELTPYRFKVTYLLLAILVVHIVILLLLRLRKQEYLNVSKVVALAAWIAIGMCLQFFYFV